MPLLEMPTLPSQREIPVFPVIPTRPSAPAPDLAPQMSFAEHAVAEPRRILVTGGSGFIGSNFIRHVLTRRPSWRIVNYDALTYAGNTGSLQDVSHNPRYAFMHADVRDAQAPGGFDAGGLSASPGRSR